MSANRVNVFAAVLIVIIAIFVNRIASSAVSVQSSSSAKLRSGVIADFYTIGIVNKEAEFIYVGSSKSMLCDEFLQRVVNAEIGSAKDTVEKKTRIEAIKAQAVAALTNYLFLNIEGVNWTPSSTISEIVKGLDAFKGNDIAVKEMAAKLHGITDLKKRGEILDAYRNTRFKKIPLWRETENGPYHISVGIPSPQYKYDYPWALVAFEHWGQAYIMHFI